MHEECYMESSLIFLTSSVNNSGEITEFELVSLCSWNNKLFFPCSIPGYRYQMQILKFPENGHKKETSQ